MDGNLACFLAWLISWIANTGTWLCLPSLAKLITNVTGAPMRAHHEYLAWCPLAASTAGPAHLSDWTWTFAALEV